MNKQEKATFWANPVVQSISASVLCIVLGLLIGFIVLSLINAKGAGEAIVTLLKNFLTYSAPAAQKKYLGNTLVKTAPLLMCALSIQFCYKVGLFNIGAAGQYVIGTCASLYAALAWGWGWLPCLLLAVVAGGVYGAIVGLLKAFCNVNEVISGIMLNWIGLYATNMLLANVKESTSPYTLHLKSAAPQAVLPCGGMDKLFEGNTNVTIAMMIDSGIAMVTLPLLLNSAPSPAVGSMACGASVLRWSV